MLTSFRGSWSFSVVVCTYVKDTATIVLITYEELYRINIIIILIIIIIIIIVKASFYMCNTYTLIF